MPQLRVKGVDLSYIDQGAGTPVLTSEYMACLWAAGCGAGSGKRPRDAIGGSLPIGSHDVEGAVDHKGCYRRRRKATILVKNIHAH
jgi:hypothetical protein